MGHRRWPARSERHKKTLEARAKKQAAEAKTAAQEAEDAEKNKAAQQAAAAAALFGAALGGGVGASRRWERAAQRLGWTEANRGALEAQVLRAGEAAGLPACAGGSRPGRTTPHAPPSPSRSKRRPRRRAPLLQPFLLLAGAGFLGGLYLRLTAARWGYRGERGGEAKNPGPEGDNEGERTWDGLAQLVFPRRRLRRRDNNGALTPGAMTTTACHV